MRVPPARALDAGVSRPHNTASAAAPRRAPVPLEEWMTDDGPGPSAAELLTRRAALQRVAALLGGALAAPTVAGVLAGCGREGAAPAAGAGAAAPGAAAVAAYRLQALTPAQERLVAAVAEHVLPTTDTPGAREARVSEFVDRMLAEYYPAADRERFVAGLGRLDARARRRHGRAFLECSAPEQYAMVDALDAQAFGDAPPAAGGRGVAAEAGGEHSAPRAAAPGAAGSQGRAAQRAPATHNPNERAGQGYVASEGPVPSGRADDAPDPADVGPKAFFRLMKELTLVGYYTSQAGATRELRVTPQGRYRGDVPYQAGAPAWA